MRKYLLILLSLPFIFTACDKKDTTIQPDSTNVLGTWMVTHVNGVEKTTDPIIISLKPDGSYYCEVSAKERDGYVFTDNFIGFYELEDNVLTLYRGRFKELIYWLIDIKNIDNSKVIIDLKERTFNERYIEIGEYTLTKIGPGDPDNGRDDPNRGIFDYDMFYLLGLWELDSIDGEDWEGDYTEFLFYEDSYPVRLYFETSGAFSNMWGRFGVAGKKIRLYPLDSPESILVAEVLALDYGYLTAKVKGHMIDHTVQLRRRVE